MHCAAIGCYDVWVDIVIPLLSALLGGGITMWGVIRTIKHERKNAQEQTIQEARPWLFSLNPLEDYDHKSVQRIIMSGSAQLEKKARLEFIIKNTDNGIGIIEKFKTKNCTYFPKVGRILEKNAVSSLYIILDNGETLTDMYLYVKDIYGNRYRYKAYQGDAIRPGNHIEECKYISVTNKRRKKRQRRTKIKKREIKV